jgi:hypothetical protein
MGSISRWWLNLAPPFQRCQLEGLIGLAHFLGFFMAPPFQSFAPSPKPERFNRLKARGL